MLSIVISLLLVSIAVAFPGQPRPISLQPGTISVPPIQLQPGQPRPINLPSINPQPINIPPVRPQSINISPVRPIDPTIQLVPGRIPPIDPTIQIGRPRVPDTGIAVQPIGIRPRPPANIIDAGKQLAHSVVALPEEALAAHMMFDKAVLKAPLALVPDLFGLKTLASKVFDAGVDITHGAPIALVGMGTKIADSRIDAVKK